MYLPLLCDYIRFFFNDTATTEIYTLSLHDALPISRPPSWYTISGTSADKRAAGQDPVVTTTSFSAGLPANRIIWGTDRKSTRLNSSHLGISYAVFCLKKKKNKK